MKKIIFVVLLAGSGLTMAKSKTAAKSNQETAHWEEKTKPNNPSSGGSAVVLEYECSTAFAGALTAGTKIAEGVTQTITAKVTALGTYNITAVANGITFSGSGTFAGTGSQNIVLTATGTPVSSGTHSFILNTSPGCNFSRVIEQAVSASSGGTAVVSAYACSTPSSGTMIAGTPVNNVTQTVTATVTKTGTYNISATTNGITFSAIGTFTAKGLQNINLTASGIPTEVGEHAFYLSTTPDCSFNRITTPSSSGGTAIVSSYSCDTAASGIIAEGVNVKNVTQTITAAVYQAGSYNIIAMANGVIFSGSGTFLETGNQTVVLTASGTPESPGEYSFAWSTTPACSFMRKIITLDPGTVIGEAGNIWYTYNLGATGPANSATDYTQYGNLYQWGRVNDGHQLVQYLSSSEGLIACYNTRQSDVDIPDNGCVYRGFSDWRQSAIEPINFPENICPQGYKIPSEEEWKAELNAQRIVDAESGYNSTLRLTTPGYFHATKKCSPNKRGESGCANLNDVGKVGHYWVALSANSQGETGKSTIAIGSNYRRPNSSWAPANMGSIRCMKPNR